MKILMVSPTLGDAYGQERVMRDSSRLLRQAGHDVYFIGDQKTGEIPDCEGYRLIPGLSSVHTLTHPRRANRIQAQAVQYALEIEPDVIHFIEQFDFRLMQRLSDLYPTILTAHTVAPSCPASHRRIGPGEVCTKKSGWLCMAYNVKYGCLDGFKSVVHRAHALEDFFLKRQITRRFPVIGAISKYVQETLIQDGWDEDRVRLIYNPVEAPTQVAPIEAPKNLIVAACRLVPLKGIDYLLRALEKIKTLDWELWICGDGEQRDLLERLTQQLGLAHRVRFLGKTTLADTRSRMAAARMVVQPNTGPEGFGLSVAEASAMGIPCVTFDVPALNEIIENEKSGLIVPPRDADALAAAISRLLLDDALQARLATGAKLRMDEKYSPETHLAQTLAAYRASQNHFENTLNALQIEVAYS